MRIITKEIVKAFMNGEGRSIGNSSTDGKTMLLHGHTIARKTGVYVQINNCGYETNTTKERLNGLLDYIGLKDSHRIYQRNFEWYWKDGESFPCNQWVTVTEESLVSHHRFRKLIKDRDAYYLSLKKRGLSEVKRSIISTIVGNLSGIGSL